MDFDEARSVLNWWSQLLDGKDASTNKASGLSPLADGSSLEWWMEHDGSTPDWRNGRTVAYLCAYLDVGGGQIPMTGIPLDDGYVWPDRAVMRTLLASGCVAVTDHDFTLTERGEALVAPFIKIEDGAASVTSQFRRRH